MQETFETLTITYTGFAAHVTLNRPEVKNAMNQQMVLDLLTAFEGLRDNTTIRAIVLSGAGGTFCAGGDIREMAQVMQGSPMQNPAALDTLLRLVNTAPQVVITRIEGAALGGGFGLMCVSDLAIAATTAQFGLPEVRLGVAPALISPFVIERIGLTKARQLMLTGARFDGVTAHELGLVHEICPPEVMDAAINATLDNIRECSPNAIRAIKHLMFTVTDAPLDATVEYRANLLTELRSSPEGQEGMMAFAQKRKPHWTEQ